MGKVTMLINGQFLLTRLIRGATSKYSVDTNRYLISTHAPHTRRDYRTRLTDVELYISTHAPHTRRDYKNPCQFQTHMISTHAPHTRRDVVQFKNYML